jgi:hypothetical protein
MVAAECRAAINLAAYIDGMRPGGLRMPSGGRTVFVGWTILIF